jgi:hypothetical protein
VNDEALLIAFTGAHRDRAADAVEPPRERRLPRHRARRSPWKPPLEPVDPQHAYDRDPLLG